MEKMRTEAVGLRMKIQELRDDRNDRQRLFDGAESKNQAALEERDSAIAEESGPDSNFIPTRIPCPSSHSDRSSMKPEQLRLQPECWNGGAAVGTRDGGATGPDPALSRQVETSNNAARDAQALLRATQEQQQQYLRMQQQYFASYNRGEHWQHSLRPAFVNSIDRAAHERIAWPRILSCGVTNGPWVC